MTMLSWLNQADSKRRARYESWVPDETGELDEDIEEAVEEGLHGVAKALADGHEREQEVAAASGRQVRQRGRHHGRAVPGGAAAPVHELQLLPHPQRQGQSS